MWVAWDRLVSGAFAQQRQASLLVRVFGQNTHHVGLDDGRMEIALAADGGRVAQPLGHALDRLRDISLGLSLRLKRRQLTERLRNHDGARPGPKVLGRELL